ncbi:hypothetical protein BU15DRAFT_61918 [Melanogaster broomeanus]|nr:hypothetical protein BU15DRAFT_61918 [Melanogaster broomeanus]
MTSEQKYISYDGLNKVISPVSIPSSPSLFAGAPGLSCRARPLPTLPVMFKHHILFLTILTFLVVVRADYAVDDSDVSTLTYSGNQFESPRGSATQWDVADNRFLAVLGWHIYMTSDNCALQFSFTGSGITVYVLRAGAWGMSASLTIDSASPISATVDTPPAPQYYIPHNSRDSSATYTVVSSVQTNQASTGTASLASVSASSTGVPFVSPSNPKNSQALNETPSPLAEPGPESRFVNSAKVNPFASTAASSTGASPSLQDVAFMFNPAVAGTSVTNITHMPGMSSSNDSSRQSPSATVATAIADPNEELPQPSSNSLLGAPGVQANPVLTDVQADFVNRLVNNNFPVPVVERVLERANDPELRAYLRTGGSPAVPEQTHTGVLAVVARS